MPRGGARPGSGRKALLPEERRRIMVLRLAPDTWKLFTSISKTRNFPVGRLLDWHFKSEHNIKSLRVAFPPAVSVKIRVKEGRREAVLEGEGRPYAGKGKVSPSRKKVRKAVPTPLLLEGGKI